MSTKIIRNVGSKAIQCEKIINYTFRKKLLCIEALQASTLPVSFNGKVHHIGRHNRLAILGDCLLDTNLCKLWYKSGSSKLSGSVWSTVRKDLLSNKTLDKRGRDAGIHECVLLNPGTTKATNNMVPTAIEAIVGAVYVDGGENAMKNVIARLRLDQHKLLKVLYNTPL